MIRPFSILLAYFVDWFWKRVKIHKGIQETREFSKQEKSEYRRIQKTREFRKQENSEYKRIQKTRNLE